MTLSKYLWVFIVKLRKIIGEKTMENDLVLLLVSTFLKIITLMLLGSYLIRKWNSQTKKYWFDFPFLMSLTFFFYALGKIYDFVLYYIYNDISNLEQFYTTGNTIELIVKFRFILSPIIVIAPFLVLMMIIWFGERRKLQIGIVTSWLVGSILGLLLGKTYSQLLLVNAIVILPINVLSIVSFFIIHHQKKLPEINSLLIAIGWFAFSVGQLIRPLWATIGTGNWGYTWLGELVELIPLIVTGLGFVIPAFYSESFKNSSLKIVKKKKSAINTSSTAIKHTL